MPVDLAVVERRLLNRWPEQQLEPTLALIRDLARRLADPQADFRTVHLTGTNGKTTTARLIDALLVAHGHRTGRFTSPHLASITERISLQGEPISADRFCETYEAVASAADAVDASSSRRLSFFEMTVAMAYQCFSQHSVDVAVVEVGMGGSWDATNIVTADVAVILPIALDHTAYLGPTVAAIAREKAGIIKRGSVVIQAKQDMEARQEVERRVGEVGADLVREGTDYAVTARSMVASSQRIDVAGLYDRYSDLTLYAPGEHLAQNVATAIAATEATLGHALSRPVLSAVVRDFISPGRFEQHTLGGTSLILDAAHNPHGARALASALAEGGYSGGVAVIGVLDDKDAAGVLSALRPVVNQVVCFQSRSPRALPVTELAALAESLYQGAVVTAADAQAALDAARELIEAADNDTGRTAPRFIIGCGSVVTASELRTIAGQMARG